MPPDRRPAVVVAVDDILDQYDDNTTDENRKNLAVVARQGRLLDFHLLVAGSVGRLSRYLSRSRPWLSCRLVSS